MDCLLGLSTVVDFPYNFAIIDLPCGISQPSNGLKSTGRLRQLPFQSVKGCTPADALARKA